MRPWAVAWSGRTALVLVRSSRAARFGWGSLGPRGTSLTDFTWLSLSEWSVLYSGVSCPDLTGPFHGRRVWGGASTFYYDWPLLIWEGGVKALLIPLIPDALHPQPSIPRQGGHARGGLCPGSRDFQQESRGSSGHKSQPALLP